ncbi:MAG: class I SAM-dependent methyltransferase [Candidatus Sericytochromatia bacterium]|nr:class I SAM-dependent methyltransferase [Candidatus Sericytochromatia bacterium]
MPLNPNELEAYCEAHSHTPSADLQALEKATHEQTDMPIMLVGGLEASLLRLLVRLSHARRILEIGTFTGYSALAMAEVLPAGGELITCDVNPESTAIARQFWAQSSHGEKISLKLGPALETLSTLDGAFDMIFIDADKTAYPAYWEACVPRLAPGGLLVVDNVFLGGQVLQPDSEAAQAVHRMNQMAQADERVECSMLSVRDGVLLAWKKR